MKNLLIILSFLFLSFTSIGQNFKPMLEVEGGYKQQINSMTNHFIDQTVRLQDDMYKYNMYTDIKFGVSFKDKLFIYQNMQNFIKPKSLTNYSPYQIIYLTTIEFKHKNISITYEHMCSHPVISKPLEIQDQTFFRQSSDKLSIKIKIY